MRSSKILKSEADTNLNRERMKTIIRHTNYNNRIVIYVTSRKSQFFSQIEYVATALALYDIFMSGLN